MGAMATGFFGAAILIVIGADLTKVASGFLMLEMTNLSIGFFGEPADFLRAGFFFGFLAGDAPESGRAELNALRTISFAGSFKPSGCRLKLKFSLVKTSSAAMEMNLM